MKKKILVGLSGLVLIIAVAVVFWGYFEKHETSGAAEDEEMAQKIEEIDVDAAEMKRARSDYFFKLLRDPATDRIPQNIRTRELEYSRALPSRNDGTLRFKSATSAQQSIDISWQSAGPQELGGRTRALGIDQRNSDIILAGAVSGGMWKSTDRGTNWDLKSEPNQNMSVTSLAQDPTNPNTWFYASGEVLGNSAGGKGSAPYYGRGIYKSTNNGDTWSLMPQASSDVKGLVDPYNSVSRIRVSPATGTVFIASTGYGIYRSTDGESFSNSPALGTEGEQLFCDVAVASDGTIAAVISEASFADQGSQSSTNNHDPGVFISEDDGQTWQEVTPTSTFPETHRRSVLSFAPSNPDLLYVFTLKGVFDTSNQGISFHKLDLAAETAEDRSENIPDFGSPVGGINTQGGYNMLVSVKPDDPDFVMVGGINLFRSQDGFATQPEGGYSNFDSQQKEEYWIGGYARANNVSQYPGQHPDQHMVAWDPDDPNEMWSAHDGGLSLTSDITAAPVSWQDKDNGYITGQFYTVAMAPDAEDQRIMGGTQDNGTPYFTFTSQNMQQTGASDISSGDGAYAHIGNSNIYASSQGGRVLRWNESLSNFNYIEPLNAENQLFIHPYEVDPNDDGIIYYPGGTTMWRNTTADEISNSNSSGTTEGWNDFTAVSGGDYTITALEVTDSQPSDRLYYAASGGGEVPKIYFLNDAATSDDTVNVSIPDAPSGAYVHDIAVNPTDGDEAIVAMSNYNIVGLYHTADGGSNWTAIEGNLEGSSTNPGPSIRSASILPTVSGPVYFVGTSTGIYSSTSLTGMSTDWTRESADGSQGSIGFSIAEQITSRPADGKVAVGTHGRGIFLADVSVNQTGDGQIPSRPMNVVASLDGTDISLNWDQNSESDISEYYIYRGESSNSLQQYATVSAASQSFTDTDAGSGSFYYAVSAYDVEGNESSKSEKSVIYKNNVGINSSWQLIGSPLTTSIDVSASGATIFGFQGVYESRSMLQPNIGYWAKGASSISIDVGGTADTSAAISLKQGWNMISGIAETINTSDIQDPNGILGSADIFRYANGSYETATQIVPASGYWIYAEQAGDITLSVDGSSSDKRQLGGGSSVSRIVFSRGNSTQQFFVSPHTAKENVREQFRMPPQSPNPKLDIRTNNGFRLADKPDTEIQLTTQDYPVSVELASNALSSYVLKGVTGRDTVMYQLAPGREMDIQRSHEKWFINRLSSNTLIQEHDLLPNYPNPFNPSTNIRYQLASETNVTIQVYNVLGRKVRTLVNTRKEPGRYNITFDGSNLSSGVYFIHLKTKNITRVQKMTLLK